MTDDHIIIDPRFCGPRDSGNGGYVCGLLAAHFDGPVEVTLWKPPLLGRSLHLQPADDGFVLMDDDEIVAEAAPASMDVTAPPAPSFEAAVQASKSYRGFETHPLPHCFVCGTSRPDGMQIYPGPVADRQMVASPWIPDASVSPDGKNIPDEFIWSALDCPGAFAIEGYQTRLLGRLTARIVDKVNVSDRTIVAGWPIANAGRKSTAGTVLYAEDGSIIGVGRAIWIELK